MFRLSCEHVVGVLRMHTGALAALFSAFAFDPLVDWWLDAVEAREKQKEHVEREGGEESEPPEGTDETQPEPTAADDLQLESTGEEGEGPVAAVPTTAMATDTERSQPVRMAAINEEALSIWRRLRHKLEGRDQASSSELALQTLTVEDQVNTRNTCFTVIVFLIRMHVFEITPVHSTSA